MVKFSKTAPDELGGPAFAVLIIEDVLFVFCSKLFSEIVKYIEIQQLFH